MNAYEQNADKARQLTKELATRVGDDGTGNLRTIVDAAIANGDPLDIDGLVTVVEGAREDVATEREWDALPDAERLRRIRDAEDRYDRQQEDASAKLDGDAPGPRGLMWGDE